ncbi:hypothetical protein IFM89_006989 [Coptis chinensis]|uniref:Cytochrome P450 n=1 Tax=Coptis chinensis TaxID=261450 RepID=A0A835LKQ1_9MAGN|nr:hypothetical protein IFM89_006989 [Coptis chinensis]
MEHVQIGLLTVCSVLVILYTWRLLNWIWLKPMKMEKYLREQGIRGPPYRLFYGNIKEIMVSMKKARSKPMELSHCVTPRILPHIHQWTESCGILSVLTRTLFLLID